MRPALAQPAQPGVEPPRVLHEIAAEYPASELAAKHEATVVLLVTVARDGTVGDVEVAQSAGRAFDEAATAAVKRWRFSPATRDGEAVASRIRVPFRFDLPRESLGPAREPHGGPSDVHELPTVTPGAATRPPPETPVEVEVHGERELRTERRSSGDFHVQRDVLRAAPRKEGAEVLRTAPGLYVGRGEGPAVAHSYVLRGFDAEHGQDIEFRVGGIPINQPSHLHGQGYADLGFLIGETVRELRVSEGVYDPKQGDFAVAGSIDVGLGVNEDERGIVLRTGYGSFGTVRQLVLWAPEGAEPETFGAVELGRTDGFGENRAARAASGIFQYKFGDRALRYRAIGILHASRADLAGVVRTDDVDSGRVCFHCAYPYATARAQNAASSRALLGLFAELRGPNGANAEAGFWTDQSNFRLQENFAGFTESSQTLAGVSGRGDLVEQRQNSRSFGLTGRYRTASYHPAEWAHGTLEVGADGRLDLVDQSQNLLDATVHGQTWDRRVDATVRGFDLGVYGDLDWHFGRHVRTRLGFRADALSYDIDDRLGNFAPISRPQDAYIVGFRRSAFGVAAGPRASAEVRAASFLSLLAAYGEGYRSPQARTLDDGEEAPFTKVHSADVGARFDWGDALRLAVGGYYTQLSDDVAFDAEQGRLERVGRTQRLGAVVHLSSRPTPWLVEALSLTVVDATLVEPPPATAEEPEPPFAEGQSLPFVPPVVLRADLGAQKALAERVLFARLVGRAGVGFSFLSPRPLPYGDFSEPVALLDASAGLALGPFDLGLEIYNLLDAEYAEVEYSFASHWHPEEARPRTPARHIAAGAPRSMLVGLGVTL